MAQRQARKFYLPQVRSYMTSCGDPFPFQNKMEVKNFLKS